MLKEHICVTLGVLVQDVTPLKNEKCLFFFFLVVGAMGVNYWVTFQPAQVSNQDHCVASKVSMPAQHRGLTEQEMLFFAATTPLLCLNNSIFVHHALTTQSHIL